MKQILQRLKSLINPEEYRDVAECAQVFVSKILSEQVEKMNIDLFRKCSCFQPSLCVDEIVNRVVQLMTTPPSNSVEEIFNRLNELEVMKNFGKAEMKSFLFQIAMETSNRAGCE